MINTNYLETTLVFSLFLNEALQFKAPPSAHLQLVGAKSDAASV